MVKKINNGLILGEDDIIKTGDNGLIEVTSSNLKELADQLQFDTLAEECILEDLFLADILFFEEDKISFLSPFLLFPPEVLLYPL